MTWRKAWARSWKTVRYCSDACRARRIGPLDRALEAAIERLLSTRARDATICPSEAARVVDPRGWRDGMNRARDAARRLTARGIVEIVQRGSVVDPSTARGPIRVRLCRRDAKPHDGATASPAPL
jgi:hypothetical protein